MIRLTFREGGPRHPYRLLATFPEGGQAFWSHSKDSRGSQTPQTRQWEPGIWHVRQSSWHNARFLPQNRLLHLTYSSAIHPAFRVAICPEIQFEHRLSIRA